MTRETATKMATQMGSMIKSAFRTRDPLCTLKICSFPERYRETKTMEVNDDEECPDGKLMLPSQRLSFPSSCQSGRYLPTLNLMIVVSKSVMLKAVNRPKHAW